MDKEKLQTHVEAIEYAQTGMENSMDALKADIEIIDYSVSEIYSMLAEEEALNEEEEN